MRSTAVLADAVPAERARLGQSLALAGYQVVEASSFTEAQSQLTRHQPELVVASTNLLDASVAQLVQDLQQCLPSPAPIVIVGDDGGLETRLLSLRAGARNFAPKPAPASLLLRNVKPAVLGGPYRLLVVDDSLTYGHALADELSIGGHDVVLATRGRDARDYLALERPDLALLDVFLPDTDGIELTRTIRASENMRDLPVFLLTGRESTTVRQRAAEVRVSDFIAKSTPLAELRQSVLRVLGGGVPVRAAGRPAAVAPHVTGPELFARVLSASGLSEVLGRSTLSLALKQAGTDPDQLNYERLQKALPHIERALNTFLAEADAKARFVTIKAIAREGASS